MKSISMLCGALAVLGTVALFWQQRSFSKLRDSSNVGFSNDMPAQHAVATDDPLKKEILSLREDTKELAKLRNEAGRLRDARAQLPAARAEAAQLLEAKESGRSLVPPPGFTSRQQLANAGFSTPEATLQTFFWAMNEGNIDMTLRAVLPASAFDKLTPEDRIAAVEDFKREIGSMAHFNDFGIRHREEVSEDRIVLHVGSSLTTNTMRMPLKRVEGEWKLD